MQNQTSSQAPQAMKLLIVEDDDLMQATLRAVFRGADLRMAESMEQALDLLDREVFTAAFLDINLKKGTAGDGIDLLKLIRGRDSYLPCVMISGLDDQMTVMKCFELGAVDYVVKASGNADVYRLALHKAMMWRKIFAESQVGRKSLPGVKMGDEMLGSSPTLRSLKDNIAKVGSLPGPFLILGETGTGKELVARALWSQGSPANRPFIPLNCASLPENLVESELFGYERGAFTGALQTKTGLFEAANGGDIFLDEIGELSIDLQAKLLRVLQEKKVRRLGSDKERPVNFRVIAATNLDLLQAVEDGDFRDDLFYRINVHQVRVPPLRDRVDDIPELLESFLSECGLSQLKIDSTASELIMSFNWPGNIRQLKAFSQYLIPHLTRSHPVVTAEIVQTWMSLNMRGKAAAKISPREEVARALASKSVIDLVLKLDGLQREYVQAALELTGNNRSQAAKLLGVSRQRLSNWVDEWGI